MANADLITGKIRGASEGTKTYYHEEGHLKFEELCSEGNIVRVVQALTPRFLLFIISMQIVYPLTLFKVLILCFMGISIGAELYEENWCWKYAKKKLKGVVQKRDEETKYIR